MRDLRAYITEDPDVDIEQIRLTVAEYAERGAYADTEGHTEREEMVGAIASRIGAEFGGWDKYKHLDDTTREDIEREIYALAEDLADDIEQMTSDN